MITASVMKGLNGPLLKIRYIYPTMIRLGIVMQLYPTQRRSKKYINHGKTYLSSADTAFYDQKSAIFVILVNTEKLHLDT